MEEKKTPSSDLSADITENEMSSSLNGHPEINQGPSIATLNTVAPMMDLSSLPLELLHWLTEYLNVRDLFALAQTSKYFNADITGLVQLGIKRILSEWGNVFLKETNNKIFCLIRGRLFFWEYDHDTDSMFSVEKPNELDLELLNLETGEEVIHISGSLKHTFVMTSRNRCFAMGKNNCGQLGLGSVIDSDNPQEITISNLNLANEDKVSDLVAGFKHSILLTEQGRLFGCGLAGNRTNNFEEIDLKRFRLAESGDRVCKIIVGKEVDFNFILTEKGRCFAWGDNQYRKLGFRDNVNRDTYEEIDFARIGLTKGNKIQDVSTNDSTTFFLSQKGDIFWCGYKGYWESCYLGNPPRESEIIKGPRKFNFKYSKFDLASDDYVRQIIVSTSNFYFLTKNNCVLTFGMLVTRAAAAHGAFSQRISWSFSKTLPLYKAVLNSNDTVLRIGQCGKLIFLLTEQYRYILCNYYKSSFEDFRYPYHEQFQEVTASNLFYNFNRLACLANQKESFGKFCYHSFVNRIYLMDDVRVQLLLMLQVFQSPWNIPKMFAALFPFDGLYTPFIEVNKNFNTSDNIEIINVLVKLFDVYHYLEKNIASTDQLVRQKYFVALLKALESVKFKTRGEMANYLEQMAETCRLKKVKVSFFSFKIDTIIPRPSTRYYDLLQALLPEAQQNDKQLSYLKTAASILLEGFKAATEDYETAYSLKNIIEDYEYIQDEKGALGTNVQF